LLAVHIQDHHYPVANFERRSQGFKQTTRIVGVDGQAIHNHFNVVYLVAVYLHVGHDIQHFVVDPDFGKTLFAHLLKQFAVMPLAATNHWRKQRDFFAL